MYRGAADVDIDKAVSGRRTPESEVYTNHPTAAAANDTATASPMLLDLEDKAALGAPPPPGAPAPPLAAPDAAAPSEPVPVASEPASATARWAEQRPVSVLSDDAVASAAGVEPQFRYCDMKTLLVSRSKTAGPQGQSSVSKELILLSP